MYRFCYADAKECDFVAETINAAGCDLFFPENKIKIKMLFSSASPIILRPTLQATSVDGAHAATRGLATPAGLVFEGVQAKAFTDCVSRQT